MEDETFALRLGPVPAGGAAGPHKDVTGFSLRQRAFQDQEQRTQLGGNCVKQLHGVELKRRQPGCRRGRGRRTRGAELSPPEWTAVMGRE